MRHDPLPPRPFPRERPSEAAKQEAAFLRRHGGSGPRLLHRLIRIADLARPGR